MLRRAEKSASTSALRGSQVELEDALLRFQGRLSARLIHAFAPLTSSPDAGLRLRAARDHLRYESSALDIASGPVPEANLLDMLAFVELAKDACRAQWNVDTHGESGAAVTGAFEAAASDAWRIARTLLRPDEEAELRRIIREWQEDNPTVDVATIRLASFSTVAGEAASRAEATARGLLSDVRRGMMTADAARLLGERALFVAQRMPFLVRLQARVALMEIVEEAGADMPSLVMKIAGAAAEGVERYVRQRIPRRRQRG